MKNYVFDPTVASNIKYNNTKTNKNVTNNHSLMFWNTTPPHNKQLLKIYKISWRHVQEKF